jgi:hypothetical protein
MSGVFLSYRRSDAQGWAGRISADLARAFGESARFFDLQSIAPGADFVQAIHAALADADAVLVLVGPQWAATKGPDGQPRLHAPDDVVAAEVAHALTLAVPVIPVLLGGAAMPGADALPPALQPLLRRNGVRLSDLSWGHDLEHIVASLEAATALRRVAAAAAPAVKVGAGLQLEDAEIGQVAGVRGGTTGSAVEVLSDATLRRVKIDGIVGVDLGAPPPPR